MEFPDIVLSCKRYKLSSGKEHKSSLNSLREYSGFKILLAIFFTRSQSVLRPIMAQAIARLGEPWPMFGDSRRICIAATAAAVELGNGTRLMSKCSFLCEVGVDTRHSISDGELVVGDIALGTILRGSVRSHVQMLSCVPIGNPSSSSCPLKLNSPSVVANSCPCGRPMH